MDYINRFLNIEPFLHSWNKLQMDIGYYYFNVMLVNVMLESYFLIFKILHQYS